jgi:hypothetical protein
MFNNGVFKKCVATGIFRTGSVFLLNQPNLIIKNAQNTKKVIKIGGAFSPKIHLKLKYFSYVKEPITQDGKNAQFFRKKFQRGLDL